MSASSPDPHLDALDHALCTRAPSCIAHAWQATLQHADDAGDRLLRRWAFLETALRYLVALLAAEHTARGLPDPPGWSNLVGAFGRPIPLGLWRDAARDLSRVLAATERAILEPVAGILAERPIGGQVRITGACRAVDRLVELRNQASHPDAPASAESLLAQSEDPFQVLLLAFRAITLRPVYVVAGVESEVHGLSLDVLELTGPGRPRRTRVPVLHPLPKDRPFVCAEDGSLLDLAPMLVWEAFPTAAGGARTRELRLFMTWRQGPVYADPRGILAASAPAGAPVGGADPAGWLRAGPRILPQFFGFGVREALLAAPPVSGQATPGGTGGPPSHPRATDLGGPGPPAPVAPETEPRPTAPPRLAERRRATWAPPPPESDEAPLRPLLPPGYLGLVCLLFPPAWPYLFYRFVLVARERHWPIAPSTAPPPYLPTERRFLAVSDPDEVAAALDDLALIVLAQRVVRGVEVIRPEQLAAAYAQPLRLTWAVVKLARRYHLPEHQFAYGGSASQGIGLRAVRRVHGALDAGADSIPPGASKSVNLTLGFLRSLAHGGGEKAPVDKVQAILVAVRTTCLETSTPDRRRPEGPTGEEPSPPRGT